jgi:hypothetical protein
MSRVYLKRLHKVFGKICSFAESLQTAMRIFIPVLKACRFPKSVQKRLLGVLMPDLI